MQLGLYQNLERQEIRRASSFLRAINTALAGKAGLEWFKALTDSEEAAKAAAEASEIETDRDPT